MSENGNTQNEAFIKDGVMTIVLRLDKGLAMTFGSIELSKDLARNWYQQNAIREAQLKTAIIKPGLVN